MSATLPSPTLFLDTNFPLFSGFPHRVADLSAESVRFGRKELELALVEMPGLAALREESLTFLFRRLQRKRNKPL